MTNYVIWTLLIPLLAGIIMLFIPQRVILQRTISIIASIILLINTVLLVFQIQTDGIQKMELGGWAPPFGIILVGDMLSGLLVLTTALVIIPILIYSFSSIGVEREKKYYYSIFFFLVTGVLGAFLTGDLFNMFVFFEVFLLSSYVLIVHGSTQKQLRESFKYVLINILSSALFVIGVAYLYAVIGTLNMAHLGERIASLTEPAPILTVIALMFLIIFGLKGAIFPLYFWLPASYTAPPTAIGALFGALLTKVGIYAIFRTYSIIFVHDPAYTHTVLGVLAALTMIFGVIGAVAHKDVTKILVYNVIVAVGFVLFGVSTMTEAGYQGAIYYVIHDMIIKAALFLLIGALVTVGGTKYLKQMGGIIKYHPALGWLFLVAVFALVGIPPLSGFIGKVLLIQGGTTVGDYWIVFLMMVASLLVLYSMIRIFLQGFYGKSVLSSKEEHGTTKGLLFPISLLIALSVLLGIGAEFLYPFVQTATEVLLQPELYINAVLKE